MKMVGQPSVILLLYMMIFVTEQHIVDGTNNKSSSYKFSALTVSKGFTEVGKLFQYGMVAEINKVTEVNGQPKVNFIMKRLPFLKHIPKLAGFFGAFGSLLSFIFSFFPRESAELSYMKNAFSEVNQKLDTITKSLEESKKLVVEYSQKSAYLRAEHNIIRAVNELSRIVQVLTDVECTNDQDCNKKKLKVMDDYKDSLNVRADVNMILRGATQDSVFGTSILKLVSESSRCDISRVKSLQGAIAALATRGRAAAMVYDLITKVQFDMAEEVKQFQKLMFALEKKKDTIILECYQNINRYLTSDALDQNVRLTGKTLKEKNKHMLQYLTLKYPWMTFYIVSVKTDSEPKLWSKEAFHNEINAKNKDENADIRNYIFIGSKNRVENRLKKEESFRLKLRNNKLYYVSWFKNVYDKAVPRLLDAVRYDKYLHNQLRAFVIVPDYEDIVIGYTDEENSQSIIQVDKNDFHTVTKNDLLIHHQCKKGESCPSFDKRIYVIATIQSVDSDVTECSKSCNSHGQCFFLPQTKTMSCKCDSEHYGNGCEMSVSDNKMALDLSKLMDISFKLPSLFDISLQLKNVQIALQADMGNIQSSIQAMDKKLTSIFGTLSRELMTSFDWHGLITQYGQIVRDLKYYYYILIENDSGYNVEEANSIQIKTCFNDPYIVHKQRRELARKILEPDALRRQLYLLNYLFIGRKDISLISHRSLLFQTMDKHREKLCSAEYKQILDKVLKQLIMLQFQGYIVWVHSMKLLNLDTCFVVEQYQQLIDRQKEFFDSNTCELKIQNSANFEDCTKGYYVYSGMKEQVKCSSGFYRTKTPDASQFVRKVIRVSSQLSGTTSSAKEIIGAPNVYPSYGRSSKAWSPAIDAVQGQFIEVAFKDQLYVKQIKIYETLNGGAVWKIEGFYNFKEYRVLLGKSKDDLQNKDTSNIFTINMQPKNWSTSQLRISIHYENSQKVPQIDAVEISGQPVEGSCSWYTMFSCDSCGCDPVGSLTIACSSDGTCSCKHGYTGKKCNSRNCVLGPWGSWSNCQCGPGKIKSRTRPVQTERYGDGRACGKRFENEKCNIACVCQPGSSGAFCENKDCLVSSWGSWDNCPNDRIVCGNRVPQTPVVYRERRVTRHRENAGNVCPKLRQSRLCPSPKCTDKKGPFKTSMNRMHAV